MKKKLVSIFAFILIFILNITPVAYASTNSIQASHYLSRYVAYVYPEGDGDLSVWFEVEGTGTMDEIGVLSIRLQEKPTGSSTWTTVKTYSHNDYSNLLGYDDTFHYSHVDYSGVEGYSYRAYITVWAGKYGEGDSREILTDVVFA